MTSRNSSCSPEKYIIALTGGIASGKTCIAELLRESGADIIDTDLLARKVVEPNSPILDTIRQEWGEAVINPDGSLNRKNLADIIFNSEQERLKLNRIMHPEIRKLMSEEINKSTSHLVVLVIPLLYEMETPIEYDESWVVYVPQKIQETRLMNRDNLNLQEARKRIDAQKPIEEKVQLADVVIDNTGDPEKTRIVVQKEWKRSKERSENVVC